MMGGGHLPTVGEGRLDVLVEDVDLFVNHDYDASDDDDNNGHLGVADDSHGDARGEHPGKGHVAAHLKFLIIDQIFYTIHFLGSFKPTKKSAELRTLLLHFQDHQTNCVKCKIGHNVSLFN